MGNPFSSQSERDRAENSRSSFGKCQDPSDRRRSGFRVQDGRKSRQRRPLASGEELACENILFADQWASIPALQGLPKNLAFIRRREPASILEATFTHAQPIGVGLMEGFFGSLHKEVGEEFERHVWGHFSSDGLRSYWALCLTGEEVEDNHQIAKKFRRMKNALDKMFTGSSWLAEGATEFLGTVTGESVRFHESVIFAEGEEPTEQITLPSVKGLLFLTDGYGPASALIQVAKALGLPQVEPLTSGLVAAEGTDSQAEDMHRESPSAS